MTSSIEDELVFAQREYIRARLKAEKTRNPKYLKRIQWAKKLLEKAENDANKTMEPKLKKKSEMLLRRLNLLSSVNCDTF